MQKILIIKTNSKKELIDITNDILLFINSIDVINGLINIYTQDTLCSISILEENITTEQNLMTKLNSINSDFTCQSETIPILRREIAISETQKIYFCELDGPKNERKIILSVVKT